MNSPTAQKNQRFFTRLSYAAAGLRHGLRSERSLRTQTLALIPVAAALLILRPAPLWWALVIVVSATVLAAELFNTALEQLADHLHPQLHPQIRIVKDCAAAGVLVIVLGALGVAAALAAELLSR